uniref:Uncharacterized protein n=1 Tax=Cuerna arida TaxID=1464854 RepID=A0A1B6GFY8_9HEMI
MTVKGPEKVRLLLLATDNNKSNSRCSRIFCGDCLLVSVAQILIVLTVFSFLAFIAVRVLQIQQEIKEKESNTIPGSDFCKSVTAENMSLVALGYLTGVKEIGNTMEARNKIYYITDRLFTDQEACQVESLLRLFQDKSVYILEIGNFTSANNSKTDFIEFLREQYTNLNLIKSTPTQFFKGSPFQNYLKKVDDFSIFAAKVLLIWQFGGMVLSPNLIPLTRHIYDINKGFCEVDRDLLYCPNQCSAYVYQLVKYILDTLRCPALRPQSMSEKTTQAIVEKTVADYCGNETATVGCVGVNRIKPSKLCQVLNEKCDFLRMQQWKENDINWKITVNKFCPKIVQKYMPYLSNTSENQYPI